MVPGRPRGYRPRMRWTVPDLPSHWAQGLGPVFVGRRRELDVLDEAWAAVLHGSRQVVFVGGEPGAGKSRLVAEVCRILHRNGAAVLVGSCAEELGPVYQPFGAIAAALQPGVADGSLEEAAGEQWAGRDEVERRLGLLAGTEALDPALVVDDRRELFDTLRGVLTAAAAARPTVVVLEDLHWAGPASLQLLGHLVEHVDGARLLRPGGPPHHRARPVRAAAPADRAAAPPRGRAAAGPAAARHRGRRGVPAARGRGAAPSGRSGRGDPARPHGWQPVLPAGGLA